MEWKYSGVQGNAVGRVSGRFCNSCSDFNKMCYIIYRTAFSLSEVRIPSGLPEARSCPHAATSSMVITVSTISFLASAQTPPDGVENSRCATNGVAQVSHILADFLSTCFINDQERSAEVFTCECGLFLPALLLGLASCTLELIAQVGAHLGDC